MPHLDEGAARVALVAAYRAVTAAVERLDGEELAHPSGCLGWTRADLLYHLLLDAQRALITFATPADDPADVDFVSYWAPFRPGSKGSDAHARFVRRAAAAYSADQVIVGRWRETAEAAARAAQALPAGARVATQGHVLAAGDFLATLTVEATIHHLDLMAGAADVAGPSAQGLAVARETFDGILGQPVPASWDDVEYALKAGGRVQLTADDHVSLGAWADRFPLLG
jgi:uncharacterized protein (TIGR03083 family)